jgi:hypothetical protein
VSIEPSIVEATFTVRTQDVDSPPKRGIPIFIAEPALTRTKYQITGPEELPEITFSGPREEIDRLSEGVIALLVLRPNDLSEGELTEQLQFEFPPNVHNVRVKNKPADYTVTFHVTKVKP